MPSKRVTSPSDAPLASENPLLVWDQGRLLVVPEFGRLLERHHLTTFQALYEYHVSAVAKNVLKERVTVRIELVEDGESLAFYLKRHSPPRLIEYIKPLIRLRLPLIGAWNEWHALREWRALSLPTQTPVAYGHKGRYSLLLTVGLEGCDKLSHLLEQDLQEKKHIPVRRRHELTRSVARLIRRMHDLGWHHQDCYAGHFLIRKHDLQPFLIDLGRVRCLGLFRKMWIRKDLAQFAFSVRGCSLSDQFRFLRAYWGRPFRKWERRWCRKILRKVEKIARHTLRRSHEIPG